MGEAAATVDYAHLSHQAGGDAGLMREVLQLFLSHGEAALGQLSAATDGKAWREAAHALKGSAKGIGAFKVAVAAEAAEMHPFDKDLFLLLSREFDAAREEITRRAVLWRSR